MSDSGEAKNANTYIHGHKAEHITVHQWRTAENSSQYLLPTLKAMAEKNPKLRLLDVGAGPGSISASLAKYIPEGEVIATDLSPDIVARAADFAKQQGVANMKCQVASIYDLPFPDASFDVIHVQQVLTHLIQPLDAMRSLLRVCRPGGVVAVREIDMRMFTFHPELPDLKAAHELLMSTMVANNTSIDMGARLVSLAMQSGIPRDRIQASMGTWCYSTPEERRLFGTQFRDRLKEGSARDMALEKGFATEAQLEAMMNAWDEWVAAEDGVFGLMSGEVLITK